MLVFKNPAKSKTNNEYEQRVIGGLTLLDPTNGKVYKNCEVQFEESTRVFEQDDLDALYVWQPVIKNWFKDNIVSEFRVTNGHQIIEQLSQLVEQHYQVKLPGRNVAKCAERRFELWTPHDLLVLNTDAKRLAEQMQYRRNYVKIARVEDGRMTNMLSAYMIDGKIHLDGRTENHQYQVYPNMDNAIETTLEDEQLTKDDFVAL